MSVPSGGSPTEKPVTRHEYHAVFCDYAIPITMAFSSSSVIGASPSVP